MMVVVVAGALTGLGVVGMIYGLRTTTPSLDGLVATLDQVVEVGDGLPGTTRARTTHALPPTRLERAGAAAVARFENTSAAGRPWWAGILTSLAVTGESVEQLAVKVVGAGAVGLLAPPMLWLLVRSVGSSIPAGIPVVAGLVVAPMCAGLPLLGLAERAKRRRRHFRAVIGSFVDLVVLGLAGGVGVEGALVAAAQVSQDWAVGQMGRALLQARDSGESPWHALARLGQRFGVTELEELSASLQLAGTEGARIRQSLSARSVSLRRHEQAEAESSANAMTERLFLPGALLLIGFLLFVGYPAFSRIIGGW